ncbi:MAG: ATPase AAA [Bacteroidetes bacterium]|nr:MAG: ATPase AAA [Bacteroidota bacterium]
MNKTLDTADLDREIAWFQLASRKDGNKRTELTDLPVMQNVSSPYAHMVNSHKLSADERFIFMLAFLPAFRPDLLNCFLEESGKDEYASTATGGRRGKYHNGFLPTVQTALFLLAGDDTARRAEIWSHFQRSSKLVSRGLIRTDIPDNGEPLLAAAISVPEDLLQKLLAGQDMLNDPDFPVEEISTVRKWEDLMLTRFQESLVNQLFNWIKHRDKLLDEWNMSKTRSRGFIALFHGLPGTGKTLTAKLIGKKINKKVYRVDLSRIISKYIGETEKNISRLLARAKQDDAILLFDEADALFGRRTPVQSAHDRYANQEIAYLLQAVEDSENMVILTSNLFDNIDKAFARRIQLVVQFHHFNEEQREYFWKKSFPAEVKMAADIDWNKVGRVYLLTPDQIEESVRFILLNMLEKNTSELTQALLVEGIETSSWARGEKPSMWA